MRVAGVAASAALVITLGVVALRAPQRPVVASPALSSPAGPEPAPPSCRTATAPDPVCNAYWAGRRQRFFARPSQP